MTSERAEVRERLTHEQRVLEEWVYDATRNHAYGVVLLGVMAYVASEHLDWTYWQVVAEARGRLTR